MSTGKLLLGIIAGVAAGATLGILLAPDKGSDTRKKILQKKDDYVGDLETKFNDFVGTVTNKFDAIKRETVRMATNGKAKMDEVAVEVSAAGK